MHKKETSECFHRFSIVVKCSHNVIYEKLFGVMYIIWYNSDTGKVIAVFP